MLSMPVLFLAARYDNTCECVESRLAEPMRAHCSALTERVVDSGHWMAQERPRELNAALIGWLRDSVPGWWPRRGSSRCELVGPKGVSPRRQHHCPGTFGS